MINPELAKAIRDFGDAAKEFVTQLIRTIKDAGKIIVQAIKALQRKGNNWRKLHRLPMRRRYGR